MNKIKPAAGVTLAALGRGEYALVVAVETAENERSGLRDLGLAPGALVRCLRPAPLGDPVAYLWSGAVVALRRSDAQRVRVKVISDAESRD